MTMSVELLMRLIHLFHCGMVVEYMPAADNEKPSAVGGCTGRIYSDLFLVTSVCLAQGR